jgi:hypothetical protein
MKSKTYFLKKIKNKNKKIKKNFKVKILIIK